MNEEQPNSSAEEKGRSTPSEGVTPEKPVAETADTWEAPEKLFQPESTPEPESEEVIIDIDQARTDEEYDPEERTRMENKYLETMKVFRAGELVNGKIVAISDSDVTVDIGFKSEGAIPVEEFENLDKLKVGDEIEIFIDSIEDAEGTLVLSKKKAEFTRVWENINRLYQTGEMVEAPIIRRIKGGMVVDLFGVEAFLPGSQIDVHPVRDFDALVGATMDFRIIKVNNARKNVVLSHKVLVEESLREIRHKVLSELEEGQVVEGVVKNITDFGVFVDLGGVDGLLHITDLSWGRVSHPSDVVKLDEKIQVKVLHYDREKQRISLGLKQLKEHHWDEIEKKYPAGGKVKGRVVSIVKYGAFVELEQGVEGLVHITEMSWTQHIKHPSQLVNVGDEIDVVVLNIDRENRKISLGMKQCEEDPWEKLEEKYQPGTRHKGIVRDLVPFGAFVELEPGIDGLIHISDLSWTRKVRHPGEIVKKGQDIEVVILNFDRNERRIALGYKQLEENPWDSFEKEYSIRSRTEGSVIRVIEKGVVVMLPLNVEGFVPNSQLGRSLAAENKINIAEGDNLELEVIEFDKANHRIILSHAAVERSKERTAYRAYKETAEGARTTIGDLMRESGQIEAEKVAIAGEVTEKREAPAEAEAVVPEPAREPETVEAVEETKVEPVAEEKAEAAPAETVEEEIRGEQLEEVTVQAEAEVAAPEPETAPEPEAQPSVEGITPEGPAEAEVEAKPAEAEAELSIPVAKQPETEEVKAKPKKPRASSAKKSSRVTKGAKEKKPAKPKKAEKGKPKSVKKK